MTPASRTSGDQCILVVEDDPALRRIIQHVLEDEGFTVESTPDGSEAVHLAQQRRPALVVLDMGLPGLNGPGVAAALREEYSAAPPILLITAAVDAGEKARQMGAFAFLRKPVELDELITVVCRGLQGEASNL